MMMKMTKGHRFVSGLIATLLIALCVTFVTPTQRVYASGNTTSGGASTESNNENDLNNVNVSMGSDGTLVVDGLSDGTAADTWNTIFNKSKVFLVGLAGIGMLVFVGLFIKNFMALGAAANNPTARSQALTGCLWTGIATAACGSVTLLIGLFWNAFK